ncbi:MAG: LamG domain-containing protein [Armatimonadetes bacterium]|nr:LamG domain-containing protein [Armatimonadota bacterium]
MAIPNRFQHDTSLIEPMRGNDWSPALFFDGADDYILAPNATDLNFTTNLTVEIAFAAISTPTDGYFITHGGWNRRWAVGITFNDLIRFSLKNGSGTVVHLYGPALTMRRWYRVAAVYDGSNMMIYLNGEPVASAAQTGSIGTTTYDVAFGRERPDTAEYLHGLLQEARIWNVALPAQTIKGLMRQRLMGTEPGLVRYWRCNEGNGGSIANLTGSGGAGTLFGPLWRWRDGWL